MITIDPQTKQLLGDDLYQQLVDMHKVQTNTDMCQIGHQKPELPILEGCQPITLDERQFKHQRDKFIRDLNDKFINPLNVKYNPESYQRDRESLSLCLSKIQRLNEELSHKFVVKDSNLYYLLSSLFSLITNIEVWNVLYPKDQIDKDSKYILQWMLKEEDHYWMYVQRRTDKTAIRNYAFHNKFNKNIIDYVIRHNYKSLMSVNKSLIEMFSYGIRVNKDEKDIAAILEKINKNETFYSAVSSTLAEIQQTVRHNYNALHSMTAVDPLMTTNIEEYYRNNIAKLYDSVQNIHKKYLDKDRKKLTGIKDRNRSYIVTVSSINDLKNTIIELSKKFQLELQKFYEYADIMDTDSNISWIIDNYQNLKCLQNTNLALAVKEEDDKDENNNPAGEHTIPNNREEYDLIAPQYWKKYTKYLNLVSLLPIHWTIGLILPNGTRIPLPIIYKFVTVIYIHPILTVIWLTINGCVVCPVVLTIDFGLKKMLGNGSISVGSGFSVSDSDVSSTWTVLFRGSMQQITKTNGGCKVAFSGNILKPIVGNPQNPVISIVDSAINITKSLPMTVDDYPPYSRLSLKNVPYLLYLKKMCGTAKPFMGLP